MANAGGYASVKIEDRLFDGSGPRDWVRSFQSNCSALDIPTATAVKQVFLYMSEGIQGRIDFATDIDQDHQRTWEHLQTLLVRLSPFEDESFAAERELGTFKAGANVPAADVITRLLAIQRRQQPPSGEDVDGWPVVTSGMEWPTAGRGARPGQCVVSRS